MSGDRQRPPRFASLGAAIDRLVDRFEGRAVPRAEWFNGAVPIALLLPLGIALPLVITGPLRAVFGWSLPASLPLALVASIAVLAVAWMWWRAGRPRSWSWLAHLLPLAVALLSIGVLYRRAFAGLTNYAGGDGGIHVAQKALFVQVAPGVYEGFVTMYALVYWVQQVLRCNDFWGFCVVYYFGVAVVAALPTALGMIALEPYRRSPWSRRAGLMACVIASVAIQYLIILPQQHYHQTDGFFTHLFGLIPLFMIWFVDVVTEVRLWRWSAVLAGIVLYRYTYGLNLGEVMIAGGALLFVDSFEPGTPAPLRWSARVAPFLLAFLSQRVYSRLEPQLHVFGWIVSYDIRTVLQTAAVACGALMLTTFVVRRRQRPEAARLFRFPVAFGAVNAVVALHIMRIPPRQPYYFLKYPMHGVVILAAGFIVAATVLTAALFESMGRREQRLKLLWAFAAVPMLLLALIGWRRAYEPLQQTFRERVFGRPPFTYNRPLADLAAWSRIVRTLHQERKQFGGYITSYWPMFNFMNAGLGYPNGGRAFWDRGGVHVAPGYCVFWDRGKVDWWTSPRDLTPNLQNELGLLESRNDAQCVSYRAYWNHAVERTLCHTCL
jgi:hypothetical protein